MHPNPNPNPNPPRPQPSDYFKIVADHLVRESGVRPLLHTLVVDAIMDGRLGLGLGLGDVYAYG